MAGRKSSKNDRLIVALDVPGLKEASKVIRTLSPVVKTFKVGKELFTCAGPRILDLAYSAKCRVFLDLKFHDIPNTVASACRAAVRPGVFMMNVHALGGAEMMRSAASAVEDTAEKKKMTKPFLIGVTVLTSMNGEDLKKVGIPKTPAEEVETLTLLAKASGLDGVVASGEEIGLIRRAAGKDFLIVTPGVRPAWAASGDQKRIVTPRQAIERGADFIVVGRPITQAPDPKAAAKKILEEINQ